MMPFVDLYAQYLSIKEEIDGAIASVIAESAFVRGRHVEEFEERFRRLIGTRHCISCGNATDALFIAMRALGVESGDEVITTAHSWIATSETITLAGGRVVFCDTEKDLFCIDSDFLESKITPRTRGIIAVHLYGQPADMDPVLDIARRHGLWVIEDCAQSHLAEYKGRRVGTLGDVAAFSFYPGKNLGAMGDAGCLVTDRDDVAEFAALFARHGGKGNHVMEGINSRMDGLQAAVLNVKMPHLAKWTEQRIDKARRYTELLAHLPGVVPPRERPDSKHVYHLYVIRCGCRDRLREFLSSKGVPTVINYPTALPFCSAYSHLRHEPGDFPVAFRHMSEILSLPLCPEITESRQAAVVDAIRRGMETLG
jgi:dTDP-4-amino-4,6-dideoxygalactose transaminase